MPSILSIKSPETAQITINTLPPHLTFVFQQFPGLICTLSNPVTAMLNPIWPGLVIQSPGLPLLDRIFSWKQKETKTFPLRTLTFIGLKNIQTEKLSAFLPSALWQDINHSLQRTVYQLQARSQRELQTSLASLNSSIYLISTVSPCLVILLCLSLL